MFQQFIEAYGMEILMAVLTFIGGYIGLAANKTFNKYIDTKEKKETAKTVVQGVEQMYKDLNGEEKLNKAMEAASEILLEKGIAITEFELRVLLEAAVGEFNENFKKAEK